MTTTIPISASVGGKAIDEPAFNAAHRPSALDIMMDSGGFQRQLLSNLSSGGRNDLKASETGMKTASRVEERRKPELRQAEAAQTSKQEVKDSDREGVKGAKDKRVKETKGSKGTEQTKDKPGVKQPRQDGHSDDSVTMNAQNVPAENRQDKGDVSDDKAQDGDTGKMIAKMFEESGGKPANTEGQVLENTPVPEKNAHVKAEGERGMGEGDYRSVDDSFIAELNKLFDNPADGKEVNLKEMPQLRTLETKQTEGAKPLAIETIVQTVQVIEPAAQQATGKDAGKDTNLFNVKEMTIETDTITLPSNGEVKSTGAGKTVEKTEVIKTFQIEEQKFVLTKKSDNSIEVSVEPQGIGKLKIELNHDKGIVHATISASEGAGKEIIEKNLPRIMAELSREGINIGDFNVNLKGQNERQWDNEAKRDFADSKNDGNEDPAIRQPVRRAEQGRLSIFI